MDAPNDLKTIYYSDDDDDIMSTDEHIEMLLNMIRSRNERLLQYKQLINHLEKKLTAQYEIECCCCNARLLVKRQ
jgi:hypothetical protein